MSDAERMAVQFKTEAEEKLEVRDFKKFVVTLTAPYYNELAWNYQRQQEYYDVKQALKFIYRTSQRFASTATFAYQVRQQKDLKLTVFRQSSTT